MQGLIDINYRLTIGPPTIKNESWCPKNFIVK